MTYARKGCAFVAKVHEMHLCTSTTEAEEELVVDFMDVSILSVRY